MLCKMVAALVEAFTVLIASKSKNEGQHNLMTLLADLVKPRFVLKAALVALYFACLIGVLSPAQAQSQMVLSNTLVAAPTARLPLKDTIFSRQQAPDLFVKRIHQENARGRTPATTTMTGVEVALRSGPRDSLVLKAEQIVVAGVFDPARVDLAIASWLQELRLITLSGEPLNVIQESLGANIIVKKLDVLQVRGITHTHILFDELRFGDVTAQNREMTFAATSGTKFRHTVWDLNPEGMQERKMSLRIARFTISEIDRSLFALLARVSTAKDPRPKFDELTIGKLTLEGVEHWQRGRLPRDAPDTLSLAKLDIDQLDRGTMQAFDLRRLAYVSNRGPDVNLSFAQMSGRNWSNRAYQRVAQFFTRGRSGRQTENTGDLTFANLWIGGPLDIGIDQFELRDAKVAAGGFDLALDRFAILTQKSLSGMIERFAIPPGQFEMTIRTPTGRNPMAQDFAQLFRSLKLDTFRASWRALAVFDPSKDRFKLETFTFVVPNFVNFNLSATFDGVQATRERLVVTELLEELSSGIFPSSEQAKQAKRARQLRIRDSLSNIKISSILAQAQDVGGLQRLAQTWADRRNARREQNGLTPQEVRWGWAAVLENRYRVSPLANRPQDMILFAPWVTGTKDWLSYGGALSATFTPREPIGLLNMTNRNPQAVEAVGIRHRLP
jgi:hypothetical protein